MNAAAASQHLKPTVFFTLILVACMMGANHVFARLAFNAGVTIATAVAARSWVTAVVVGLIVWQARLVLSFDKKQKLGLLSLGLLIALQSQLLYAAVARLPVALALLIFSSFALWASLWEWLLHGVRPPKHQRVAVPVILLGLSLALDVQAAFGSAYQTTLSPSGVLLALAAAIVFGLALMVTTRHTQGVDGRVRTVSTQLIAGLVALALLATQGGAHWPSGEAAAAGWLGLGLLALLYGTAFTMLFTVLPKMGAVGNSAVMNTEPIFALLIGWLVLGQTISYLQIVGCVIVVSAVIWLGTRK